MRNPNPRLKLDQSVMESIVAMSDGNPGALSVLAKLIQLDAGIFALAWLDDAAIYGEDIWIGFKDVCGEDIEAFRQRVNDDSFTADISAAKEARIAA